MIGTLSDLEIEDVLQINIFGRIGCSDGHKTYVVPINYVYDGKYIIAHSMAGMKIEMMRHNPNVCFEVDEIKNYTHWRSVIAWGQYQELTNEHDRYLALKLFVDKMMHQKISKTAIAPEIVAKKIHPDVHGHLRPVIYRIMITEKSGRYENE